MRTDAEALTSLSDIVQRKIGGESGGERLRKRVTVSEGEVKT